MSPHKTLIYKLTIFLISSGLFILGCGGGGSSKTDDISNEVEVTQEKLPPGALPDVSAELGGEGFTGDGWTTNSDYESTGDPRAIPGGKFTYGQYSFPATLRTIGKDSNSEFIYRVENMIYESLIGTHPLTMAVVPSLATHWLISEDKQTFKFRINPDARFSDGGRITFL